MDINAIGIPLTFLVLCAIGLWMIIFSKGFWALKTLFITFCLYFSFAMWFSLSDLSGWATSVSMPQKSIIHWVLVQEPSKFNKNPHIVKEQKSWLIFIDLSRIYVNI